VFPCFCLYYYGASKKLIYSLIPVISGGCVLLLQYDIIYIFHDFDKINIQVIQEIQGKNFKLSSEDSGVSFGWLDVWNKYSIDIPLSILNSLLLPLLILTGYPKECFFNKRFQFSAALQVISLLLFSIFYETGRRSGDGKFLWQNIITNYILHLVVIIVFYSNKK